MKIYTKTGDKGMSSLWGGQRVSKGSLRIESYGTVDELNSILGMVGSVAGLESGLTEKVEKIQGELMIAGSDLATPIDVSKKIKQVRVGSKSAKRLEREIDKMSKDLPQLTSFILPSGSFAGSTLHHARAVCRRAERLVVRLSNEEPINEQVVIYLNRLSDWLFTAARWQNKFDDQIETPWHG
ncbi:MAG: cob(I)yrinic acid a,c-diamide adenosyltransferase [Candidatus Dojkabacteria bacterium]